MKTYKVSTPIWCNENKKRAIGVAEFRIPTLIEITYKDKRGNQVYPHKYKVGKEFSQRYPIQIINKNLKLRIIPIEDLEVIES